MLSSKNLGIAITAVAVVAGLMIGVAGPGRAQDKAADPKAPAKNWKDNNEFVEADAALKETDPAKKLAALDKWKKDYPSTEYIDDRQGLYFTTYVALGQARQAFDMAQEMLKINPKDTNALYQTVFQVMKIKPAPTEADMAIAEKDANLFIDNPDSVKPPAMDNAAWDKTKAQLKAIAEQTLMSIYDLRKNDKRAVDDLTKLLQRDPTVAAASYKLGQAMLAIIKVDGDTSKYPTAFYHIARSLAVTGPGALPDNQKPAIQTFLTNAYKSYHASDQGLPDVLALAKSGPFPPANFSIKSTVDIAKEAEAARQEEIKKDPIIYLWVHTVKEMLAMQGEAFWGSLEGTRLPGPDPDDKSEKPAERFFKAHIISMTPATKPKEIMVGIEKPDVADAKLTFEMPPPGKMDAGEEIQFYGTAKDWSHDQKNVIVTFAIEDYKEDLNNTWTGKNTPAPARGGGAKGAAKSTGTSKAPTK